MDIAYRLFFFSKDSGSISKDRSGLGSRKPNGLAPVLSPGLKQNPQLVFWIFRCETTGKHLFLVEPMRSPCGVSLH